MGQKGMRRAVDEHPRRDVSPLHASPHKLSAEASSAICFLARLMHWTGSGLTFQ